MRSSRVVSVPSWASSPLWWPSRQGSLWRERPPKTGGGKWWALGWAIYPSPVAHQRRKSGGRSLHFPPSRCGAPGEAGHAGRPPPRWLQPTRGIRANSCPIRLSGQGPDHSSEGSPSEREALWWSKACATWVGHPPGVNGPPLRRHVLDPARWKSSILSRPFGAGSSCSHWTTSSMTTSKPPWPSTVSQSASDMACPQAPPPLAGGH